MDGEGPLENGGGGSIPATGWWCRHCDEPVTLTSRTGYSDHVGTGAEKCADGEHVAAPTSTDPVKRDAARRLTAEFAGWHVAWFYGCYRAWNEDRPTVVPVEARTEEDMRTALNARRPSAMRRLR